MTTATPHKRALVLASASPRRRELLGVLGVEFKVAPADIDETVQPGETPEAYVRRMALGKAEAGYAAAGSDSAVLGSDTAVVIDGRILGKPDDRAAAIAMLTELSGRTHRVMSAVALLDVEGCSEALSVTEVTFRTIIAKEADQYWATGEPADKAGGYGIQGRGAVFVRAIQGSYSGVVGLPLFETAALLEERGYGPLMQA
ncbi:MAG: septum formation inhibitor Maf [Gammaproteobacteria bacterium]|nr:septum formation inhibitor Maf [Gammaproteobacteria bacterium]